ncbi:nitrile hydratase subunit alpha [Sorangium sp. So ce1128]
MHTESLPIEDKHPDAQAKRGLDAWLASWLRAVQKAWTDADYKARLLDDPRRALREIGYALPDALELKVVEVLNDDDAQRLPPSSFEPSVFEAGASSGPQELTIGLFPPPADLADGLIALGKHSGLATLRCFCGCG